MNETTKVGSAQYFFVTPKVIVNDVFIKFLYYLSVIIDLQLLRNLKANKRMSVHVVFNGRMVEPKKAFTII